MKHHLYLVESHDDAKNYDIWRHILSAPGVHQANGLRLEMPGIDVKEFGAIEANYGMKMFLRIAIQRDLMTMLLRKRDSEVLEEGDLRKLGELAAKLVDEYPEMLAIRALYTAELKKAGLYGNCET